MSEQKWVIIPSGLKRFLLKAAIIIITIIALRYGLSELGIYVSQRETLDIIGPICVAVLGVAFLTFFVLSLFRLLSTSQRIKKRKAWHRSIRSIVLIIAFIAIIVPEPTPSEVAKWEAERAAAQPVYAHQKLGKSFDKEHGKGFMVKKAELPTIWPFKNAELATIRCSLHPTYKAKMITVQFDEDNKLYALNGAARGPKRFPDPIDYVDVKSGETYESAIPIGWISHGEALCREKLQEGVQQVEKEFRKCFSAWDGSVYEVMAAVKNQMHDPSSFEHVATSYKLIRNQSAAVTMVFRGRNAFGALIMQKAIALIEPKSCGVLSVNMVRN